MKACTAPSPTMATHDDTDANTDADEASPVTIPTTDEYREDTREVHNIHLPKGDFDLPIYNVPPGRLMAVIEQSGLTGMFGVGDADMDEVVDEETGDVVFNDFMSNEIVPNVAVEETDLDAVHWNDDDLAADPDVRDFDISELKTEDLGALVRGMMFGDEDVQPGDQLEQFRG